MQLQITGVLWSFNVFQTGKNVLTMSLIMNILITTSLITKFRIHFIQVLHPPIHELMNFGAAGSYSASAGVLHLCLYLTSEHLIKMSLWLFKRSPWIEKHWNSGEVSISLVMTLNSGAKGHQKESFMLINLAVCTDSWLRQSAQAPKSQENNPLKYLSLLSLETLTRWLHTQKV